MGTSTTVLARFPYRYGSKDWRKDPAESFQKSTSVETDYTVIDGQIVQTVETTQTFASPIAQVASNPITGPPYLYADGNFRADPALVFQKTHIKTTTYEQISETSYLATIDDYDVLAGTHTITHVVIDGKLPLAQTIGSALSSLVQRPITGTLSDPCDFTQSTTAITATWAESAQDISAMAKRARQRATAILRRINMRANPLIRRGSTVRVINAGRNLIRNHVVVEIAKTYDTATGDSSQLLSLEDWVR